MNAASYEGFGLSGCRSTAHEGGLSREGCKGRAGRPDPRFRTLWSVAVGYNSGRCRESMSTAVMFARVARQRCIQGAPCRGPHTLSVPSHGTGHNTAAPCLVNDEVADGPPCVPREVAILPCVALGSASLCIGAKRAFDDIIAGIPLMVPAYLCAPPNSVPGNEPLLEL